MRRPLSDGELPGAQRLSLSSAGPVGLFVSCCSRLNLLFGDAKLYIFARVVKDVNVIPYMAVFLYAELAVAVQGNVQCLVSLRDVDRAVIELE
jgi:hypothetical protein